MPTWEYLNLSNSKSKEKAHIGLMTDVEHVSDDEEVDLSNIYSIREAYIQLASYTKCVKTEFKTLNRKHKTIISNLDSLNKISLELSQTNNKLEKKRLNQAIEAKNY